MSDARWQQVKALFQATLERPPAERAAFLAAATGGDDALRREIESLLDSDGSAAGFTDRLPVRNVSPMSGSPSAGFPRAIRSTLRTTFAPTGNVGPYRITGLLGAGGMGEVFRAQDSTLKRDVALKMLPSAYAFDPDRLARFRREAHALAALNHPHIAAIYGLQESDGRQALVLELVEGVTLADRIRKGPVPLIEALTDRASDRRSTPGCSCERHHSSRSEAGQYQSDSNRRRESARLRVGEELPATRR